LSGLGIGISGPNAESAVTARNTTNGLDKPSGESSMKLRHLALGAAAFLALTGTAQAKVLMSGTYAANFSFATPTAFVPLTSTGVTSRTVNITTATTYVLTFSAECAVDAPAGNSVSWIDLDILVDGVAVSPTAESSDAFCAANGTAGFDGWVRPSITVPVRLTVGTHTIQVQGRLDFGATGGWISDIAVVLHD
jgi:hypothetical protein